MQTNSKFQKGDWAVLMCSVEYGAEIVREGTFCYVFINHGDGTYGVQAGNKYAYLGSVLARDMEPWPGGDV